ncbi:enoyl-CoA hydratase [Sulfolobus sp. A20]|uniref:enoyl-CoA hydratase/isomerase family protein n=1 Tax=Sulfolobaceae TaxID=118883 RepID=UPI0008460414|nr:MULTISPECIES: enoyl-CoA hydratase/isomerase family protein [unclassified Sulfolobus]TRM75998.1 enoyl-CoA hydratase/isomerase family protein [Sulfolobus sp. E5]TRM78482.1 enoyl-CoA hydratase/isomerase family protein [Sulfolobus sp. B5]TRM81418.1 enoyl-CoA hydratase/isomerase family protein [Sulfolobus sp. D5]TRM85882.1 enoyl-CoA hydratase/isomerase family protein [Sulfolobus sp. C3]TRM97763.1 enoyl-CoA hydratase/isomerase family protein [Sulfolobus sp. F1]TRN04623.1 enoyl-CoA hydratase/isom
MIKVEIDKENKIGKIFIDRQEKMNAITVSMRREIGEKLLELDKNQDVRVIIVKGLGGKAFSSGGDVSEFLSLTPETLLDWGDDLTTSWKISKPVIASIDGYAFGAGLELALSCDIRVATPKSEFAFPEIRLGMVPASGGLTRIIKTLGISRATYMLLLGKRINADLALQWGIVHEVVEPEKLDERTYEIAKDLASLSPLAVKALKKVIYEIADSPFYAGFDIERKTFGLLRYSEDFREGVDSFLNKRKPKFNGK